jgi:sugar-specific transcriptional regulator TrmB
MINEVLKKLGFGDKEIEVYLAILKHGKITPAELAKTTGINRTTIYSVSKELVKKGVITEDLGGSVVYFVASPPKDLGQIIKKEEKQLEEKKGLIDNAIKELADLAGQTKYSIPKIIFVAEEDLENYLYKQTPIWNKSIMAQDNTWWGFQDSNFVRYYEKWIDWYWESGSSKEINLKLLSNESAEDLKEKKYARRKIKFWNQSKDFNATVWIIGNYLVMIITSQNPHYLVEIHDETLANNLRLFFKGVWTDLN